MGSTLELHPLAVLGCLQAEGGGRDQGLSLKFQCHAAYSLARLDALSQIRGPEHRVNASLRDEAAAGAMV
jgi:hypothetical protein